MLVSISFSFSIIDHLNWLKKIKAKFLDWCNCVIFYKIEFFLIPAISKLIN